MIGGFSMPDLFIASTNDLGYSVKRNLEFLKFFLCSVFDVDDDTIPVQFRNGYSFLSADERVKLLHKDTFLFF